mmetsp:Transcript_13586/g.33322  ORF Transcript_13586/g.33322 Transcript_13586/m.33322 type:complete len:276 (-) Transcript_13586:174-1001(-)
MKCVTLPLSTTGKMETCTNRCDMSEGLHVHMSMCCVLAEHAPCNSTRNTLASVRGPKTTFSVRPRIISSFRPYISKNLGLTCFTDQGFSAMRVSFALPSSASAIFLGTQSPWSSVRIMCSISPPAAFFSGSSSIRTMRSSPLLLYSASAVSRLSPSAARWIKVSSLPTLVEGPCMIFRLRPTTSLSLNPSTSLTAGLMAVTTWGGAILIVRHASCPTYTLYPRRALASLRLSPSCSGGFSWRCMSLTAPSTNWWNEAGSRSCIMSSSPSSSSRHA